MKKILAFLCALAICFAVFPDSVAAAESDPNDYIYSVENEEATIKGFAKYNPWTGSVTTSGKIELPSYIYELTDSGSYIPVTRIGDSAFCDAVDVTSFIIPNSVTSIGSYAFQNCSSLSSVTIPDSVTSIGPYAFQNCSSLSSVTIPDGVTSIGEGVFYYCSSLSSITIPDSLVSIGVSAFLGCSSLSSVTIPDSVTSIGINAFLGCSSLSSITIPDGVTSIEQAAFRNCSNLSSVTIPDSVTSIGNAAFYGCSSLSSITIPDSVTSIKPNAFAHSSLRSITIPDSVTSISASMFSHCSSLSSITIPDSVTSIEMSAFFKCSSLSSITIPIGVTSIADKAFYNCAELNEIVFKGDAPSIGELTFNLVTAKAYYPANNPTWTEEVMQDYGGTITWVPYEAEEESAVEEWNVSLEDDLKVNFYLDGDTAETAEVTVTVGDSGKTCNISELEKDENGRYIVSVNVAAAQMTDEITIQVTDMEPAVYTVRQYCDTILGDESYSQYHQLVKEMLNYGAMAQIYFDHNSENLANNDITGVAAKEVPDTTTDLSFDGEADGVEFYGASLVYRDKIAVRYYCDVTDDASSITFTANGNVYTPVLKDGRYYVEVADILPQDLEQQITLTATDSAGNTLTVCYGPMNYIVRMNQKGSESAKALLKALYNYHLAAKALRTETV